MPKSDLLKRWGKLGLQLTPRQRAVVKRFRDYQTMDFPELGEPAPARPIREGEVFKDFVPIAGDEP
jgi:hypothetical protein